MGLLGDWRKLHREELHDLYSSPVIILLMSRRVGFMGIIVWMGERRNTYRVLWVDLK